MWSNGREKSDSEMNVAYLKGVGHQEKQIIKPSLRCFSFDLTGSLHKYKIEL